MKPAKNKLDKLSTLNGSLPYGSRKIIAKRTGKTLRYVSRVLNGFYASDMKVIRAAIDYYIEYKAEQEKLNKDIEIAIQKR